jgi:hypothetical protein
MKNFQDIGIKSEIRALYSHTGWGDQDIVFKGGEEKWLTSAIIQLYDLDYEQMSEAFGGRSDTMEVSSYEADEINKRLEKQMRDVRKKGGKKCAPILLWVTPPSNSSRVEVHYAVCGNEVSVETSYVDLNLVVTIPPASMRAKLLM